MQGKINEPKFGSLQKKRIVNTNKGYNVDAVMKFQTKEGKRYYKGSGSSKDLQRAANKATFNARFKAAENPADSMKTSDFKKFKTELVNKKK